MTLQAIVVSFITSGLENSRSCCMRVKDMQRRKTCNEHHRCQSKAIRGQYRVMSCPFDEFHSKPDHRENHSSWSEQPRMSAQYSLHHYYTYGTAHFFSRKIGRDNTLPKVLYKKSKALIRIPRVVEFVSSRRRRGAKAPL